MLHGKQLPFLECIFLFKTYKINNKYIKLINSALLWILWIIFRFLGFILFFYLYYTDYNYIYANANEKYITINFNIYTTIILFILNIYWFISVHKGFIKQLRN